MNVRTVLLAGAVALLASLTIFALSVDLKLLGDNSGYKPAQPIAYSHALHAGELRMDCLFCHTGAEKGRHAGIPPASTCMKCHEVVVNRAGTKPGVSDPSPEIARLRQAVQSGQPIAWVRVHRLPAHVQFPHSRHVNAGVPCQACHGEVQGMERVEQARPLNMGECLACHRAENQKQQQAGRAPGAPTDCTACHH
ncbi:MAG: cytochrome c3 family protein [Acidobacteria bacterium]|nr:cytochrome c3 family protein [Acidobacteriota bacterium]